MDIKDSPAPKGTRWAVIAPPGTWTQARRAEHAADIAAWKDSPPNEGGQGSNWGPPCAPGLPCCVLATGTPWGDAAIAGASLRASVVMAEAWGGRPLAITPDGAVWAAVALRRPSQLAGEREAGIRLAGAFRLVSLDAHEIRSSGGYGPPVAPVMLVGPTGEVPLRRIMADPALVAALRRHGWEPLDLAHGQIRDADTGALLAREVAA